MDKPIVACIQLRLIIPKTPDEYDAHLHRFLRTAKTKGAELALFPELSGIATAFPLFSGWRHSLLREANQGKRGQVGFWQRTKSKLAGSAASVMKADLQASLQEALKVMPESLHDAYVSGFSSLARQYEMTIVAGSLYERETPAGEIRNVAYVFGPDGDVLGTQEKVVLSTRDSGTSQPGEGWGVIPTPIGRVGILLGNDVLYPEAARILAYQGADMLLTLAATTRPATYHKIRSAALARCQENQLYGMVSFLTGPDPFADQDAPPFVGRSGIFAPIDFTHRFTGVMVEVGSPLAEAVITAEWDYPALNQLWQESDTPMRRDMPLLAAGPILANVYGRALSLSEADQLMLAAPDIEGTDVQLAGAAAGLEQVASEGFDDMDGDIEPEDIPPLSALFPYASFGSAPEDLQQAQQDMSGRVEIASQNMESATDEVRETIALASEQVRVVAASDPEIIDDQIEAMVLESTQMLSEDAGYSPVSESQPTGAGLAGESGARPGVQSEWEGMVDDESQDGGMAVESSSVDVATSEPATDPERATEDAPPWQSDDRAGNIDTLTAEEGTREAADPSVSGSGDPLASQPGADEPAEATGLSSPQSREAPKKKRRFRWPWQQDEWDWD